MKRKAAQTGMSPIVLIIMVVLGMGLAGYLIWRWQQAGTVIDLNPGTGVSTTNEEGNGTPSPNTSPTVPGMPVGWEVFESVEHGFRMAHPSDVLQERRPGEGVHFLKFGPTQELGTELYDGISVMFNSGEVVGEGGFAEFVRSEFERMQSQPAASSVSDFGEVSVGVHTGYAFKEQGLGEYTHVYLPKNEGNAYLHIIDGTQDPTGQGFIDAVGTMLATIEFTGR